MIVSEDYKNVEYKIAVFDYDDLYNYLKKMQCSKLIEKNK